ncbi:hypothetical protein DXG01_010371 [Tephrocybe rancida]|nr:hypothetical protein DXG01_010371 [Tephrocybe rancida]
MAAPQQDPKATASTVYTGLLTPQPSFSQNDNTTLTPPKRKRSSGGDHGDDASEAPTKKARLEVIAAALQGHRSASEIEVPRSGGDPDVVSQPPRLEPSTHFVWLDLEVRVLTTTAGIPFEQIRILEIAVRITDKDFAPLDDGISLLVHWSGINTFGDLSKEMIPKVIEMHQISGLQKEYDCTPPADRKSLDEVETLVCEYVRSHGISSKAIMAGGGIGFDRAMIRSHMSEFDKLFHHQVFDTTTLWSTGGTVVKSGFKYLRAIEQWTISTALYEVRSYFVVTHNILMTTSWHKEAKLYAELVFKLPSDVTWPSEQDGI